MATQLLYLTKELIIERFEQLKISNSNKYPDGLIKKERAFIYEAFSDAIDRDWFSLSQDILQSKMSNLTDETRIRLLLPKFGPTERSQNLHLQRK